MGNELKVEIKKLKVCIQFEERGNEDFIDFRFAISDF